MKTSKWLVITLAAALTAGGLLTLNARPADHSRQRQGFGGLLSERAKAKLGLTDEQTAQIKAVLKSEKDNITSLLAQLHEARVDLRKAIRASDATEASVRVASAKVAAAEADMAVERFKLHGKISPILTEQQREKLVKFRAKMDESADGMIDRIGERLGE